MPLARALFVFALLTPVLGATGSRFVVSALLGQSPRTVVAPASTEIAVLPTQMVVPVATPAPPTAIPPATATPPVTATPAGTAGMGTPAASPTSSAIALVRSWLGETTARGGETLTISYAIENDTGTTVQLALGVSMKPSTAPSWISAFADPSHDVVAAVPPGSSTHERFFTLPAGLAPGSYDVSWGLRGTGGEQIALGLSSAALHVVK